MRKPVTLSLAFAFAMVMAVAVAARSTSSGQYGQSYDQTMHSSSKAVKLTGCLESGAEPDTFKLTNVTGDLTGMSGKGTEAEGTSGTSGTSDTDKTVELSGSKKLDSELKNHIGHKVEVTGSWDMSKSSSSSSSSSTGTSGQSGMSSQSSMSSTSGMRLKVTSFRHISETCTPE